MIVPKTAIALTACLAAAASAQNSPLPAPTGQHQVGRVQFDWVDTSRADPHDASRKRELVVWVWYPAAAAPDAVVGEWMPGEWGTALARRYSEEHPGTDVASLVPQLHSHSYVNGAIDPTGKWPLVLFAPGLGTMALDYSVILEDLASHGYVVLGVGSPEFARVSVYGDGRVVRGKVPLQLAGRDATAIRAIEDSPPTMSADLRFALNRLAATAAFKNHIDTTRVGAAGHSIGGAAAAQFAHDDARVKAVFDLDGTGAWSSRNGALENAVLVLSAAASAGFNYPVLSGARPGLHLRLAGAEHSFSMDEGALSVGTARPAGSLQAARALEITARYMAAFFNQYLNGQLERLLDGPDPQFPEVTFERGAGRPPRHGSRYSSVERFPSAKGLSIEP